MTYVDLIVFFTVVLELDHEPVDDLNPSRALGEPDAVAGG